MSDVHDSLATEDSTSGLRPVSQPLRSRPTSQSMLRLLTISYGSMALVGIAIAWISGHGIGSLLGAATWRGHLTSLGFGLGFGLFVVFLTRWIVKQTSLGVRLHEDMRPMAAMLGRELVWPAAVASSIGEEILFRGALVPWVGIWISTITFALMHQMRGRSRWVWIGFAGLVGLVLAVLFERSASLLGPIVAHMFINGINLRFLMDHDPRPRADLGGLLRG